MSLKIIKDNPIIFAGLVIALSIYVSANQLSYQYLNIGSQGYMVLKNGELKRFCDIAKDYCYIKNKRGDYYPEKVQLETWLGNN